MTEATGADIHIVHSYDETHRAKAEVCQHCGEPLSRVGIVKLAYTFEVCECDAAPYTHLVEQLWHRDHLTAVAAYTDQGAAVRALADLVGILNSEIYKGERGAPPKTRITYAGGLRRARRLVDDLLGVAQETHATTIRQVGAELALVELELRAQDRKWGQQNHPDGTGLYHMWSSSGTAVHVAARFKQECQDAAEDGTLTWAHIAKEEFSEAMVESQPDLLREELLQTAAVLVNWSISLRGRVDELEDRYEADHSG